MLTESKITPRTRPEYWVCEEHISVRESIIEIGDEKYCGHCVSRILTRYVYPLTKVVSG